MLTGSTISGPALLELPHFRDERGDFTECFRAEWLSERGIRERFVQDNCSRSIAGVIRGLHYQIIQPQSKLVMVLAGRVRDAVVDLRRGSPTFGRASVVELRAERPQALYIPVGFAHGFSVLEGPALVFYKCGQTWCPEGQRGLRWDDPTAGIDWGIDDPILNARDRALPLLSHIPTGDLFAG